MLIAGLRWQVSADTFKNKGALMQLGLMRYGFDKLMAKGFTPMIPPVLDLPRSFTNIGHFPWGQVDVYKTFDDREEQNIRHLWNRRGAFGFLPPG